VTAGASSGPERFASHRRFAFRLPYLVFDTDFLIKVANDPIRRLDLKQLASEYTIATIPGVVSELEGLTHHREKKTARRAANTLRVLEESRSQIKVKVLEESRAKGAEADMALVELARNSEGDATIATMDHSLLSRLERMRLPYLTLSDDKPLMRTFPREQRI